MAARARPCVRACWAGQADRVPMGAAEAGSMSQSCGWRYLPTASSSIAKAQSDGDHIGKGRCIDG